jgi:PAS domain S-box-containing protein
MEAAVSGLNGTLHDGLAPGRRVTGSLTGGESGSSALARLSQLTRQLEQVERERDQFWENSPDLLAVANPNGYLVRTNPAWRRLLGWESGELELRRLLLLLPEADQKHLAQAWQQLRRGETVEGCETRVRTASGAERWVQWNASSNGHEIYLTGRDITHRKANEAQLQALRERLRQEQAEHRALCARCPLTRELPGECDAGGE